MVGQALEDPLSYDQAMASPNKSEWQAAIDSELDSVASTGTWIEVIAPTNRKLIGSKWVFKTKVDALGNTAKYKAHIVAQGFSQIKGIDFDETYSPVARLTSLRILLSIVAKDGLLLHQMDADTAFLNGKLDEELYMAFPPGYHQSNSNSMGLKLIKLLYGLKQSPRVWWKLLSSHLIKLGFNKLDSDWGMYYQSSDMVFLLVYVDDVLLAAPSITAINSVKAALSLKWKWMDMGEAALILGLKINRDLEN